MYQIFRQILNVLYPYCSTINAYCAWLDKLEGGIEQLKKVIIDDALDINTELEKEMQFLVDAYKCEWKEAIENEESKKRFSHFVNSDNEDDTIVFVPMREQQIPAPWE